MVLTMCSVHLITKDVITYQNCWWT